MAKDAAKHFVTVLLFALLSWRNVASGQMQFVFVLSSIPFASAWLLLFWRRWTESLPTASEQP